MSERYHTGGYGPSDRYHTRPRIVHYSDTCQCRACCTVRAQGATLPPTIPGFVAVNDIQDVLMEEPYCAWCSDGTDAPPYCGNPGCKDITQFLDNAESQ